MSWRDRALRTAGFVGDVIAGWADDSLQKAAAGKMDEESQERTPGGDATDSAENAPIPDKPATQDPKSIFFDPFSVIENLGYKDKPSSVTYDTLRAMVWKMPILSAIVQTRINQIASFASPQHDRYQMGFRLKLRDTDATPTPEDKKWMQQCETLLLRTGVTDNPRGRPNFETFLRKLAWDTLVYDQMCFETVPNRMGQPAEWYAVDAATIRLADTAKMHLNEDDTDAVRYVQIYDGMIIAEYNQEELCFGVRNPRTDIRLQGYGVSETEMLISTVTALLHAWTYNQKFFSQGSAAKGILNFKGAIPDKQMKAFRRHWYGQLASVANAWRTPITNAEGLEWINLQTTNREMEFSAWFDFQIKIACGIFAMDPGEINFRYGNTGQKSSMQEANNKDKITESKERGLRPLLRFLATNINRHIIWPLNENFEFEFVGLDAKTQDEVADLNTKRVKTYRTIDELRAEDGLEPLPDGKGEIILDPTYMQFYQLKEGGGEEGAPDFGGGGSPDEADDDEQTFGDFDFKKLLGGGDDEDKDSGNDTGPAKPAEAAKPAKGEEVKKSLVWEAHL